MQLHKILSEKKDKTQDSQESKDIMAAVNANGDGVSGGIQTDGSKEGESAAKKELAAKHKAAGGNKRTLFKPKLTSRDAKVGGVPPPAKKKLAEGVEAPTKRGVAPTKRGVAPTKRGVEAPTKRGKSYGMEMQRERAKGIGVKEEKMTPEEVAAANHNSAKRAMGGLPVPGKKTRELIKSGKGRGEDGKKIPSEPDTYIDEGRDPNSLHKLLEAHYSAEQIRSGSKTLPSDKGTGGSKANRRGDRAIGLLRMKTGSGERGIHPKANGERAAQGHAEGNYYSGRIMAKAYGRTRKRLSGGVNESTQYPNLHKLLESKRNKALRKAVGIDRIKRGSDLRNPASFPGYDNMQSSNPDIRARSNKAYQYDASKRVAKNRAIRNSQ